MTLNDPSLGHDGPPRDGVTVTGWARSTQKFRRQRPGDGPSEAKAFAVEKFHRRARGRIRAFNPGHEIADNGFVNGELTVRAELHDQGTEQLIVGFEQRYRGQGAQARAQVAKFDV